MVCNCLEGYPVAAHFNRLGYNVFVLNYRIGGKQLFPKPMEDLAQALKFIFSNKEQFGLLTDRYALGGFSAGGNLICIWGTEQNGYAHYNLPAPVVMFPIYPAINNAMINENISGDPLMKKIQEMASKKYLKTMFGKNPDPSFMDSFNVDSSINERFPKCFIAANKDDEQISFQHSVRLKQLLDQFQIPAELMLGQRGGHGFGDGVGTDCEGWVEAAARFLEKYSQ